MKRASLFLPVFLIVFCISLTGCGESATSSGAGQTASEANRSTTGTGQSASETSQTASAPSGPAGGQNVLDLLNRGDQVQGMTFDFQETFNGQVTGSGKFAVDGGKFRVESAANGVDSVIICDGEAMYMYSPDQKIACKISSVQQDQKVLTPLDYNKTFTNNVDALKFLDTVNYNGMLCKLYSLSVPGAGDEKIWFSADYGLPVRIETSGAGNTMIMEYNNLKIAPQPPETFRLPAGINAGDLGSLMQQPVEMPKSQ